MTPQQRAVMERVDQVEEKSFVSLYEHAPPELNAGHFVEDGVSVAWLGSYADAAFTAISAIDAAPDPDATLARILERLRQTGVAVVGLDDHPDLDPAYGHDWIVAQGFEPDSEEQIDWMPLDTFTPEPTAPGIRVEQISDDDAADFASILNEGFGAAADAGLGPIFASVIGKPGWLHYIAYVDGEPGAAAALFIADNVADCFIAATRPSARRRGAQTALINRRLQDGRTAGCDIATAQSVIGSASPRNFGRRGFMPVYRRTIYARRLREC